MTAASSSAALPGSLTDSTMESKGELDHSDAFNPPGCPETQSCEGNKDNAEGGDESNSPSPQKSSGSDTLDCEPQPPPVVIRKVSFADAFGLDLVSVKEFDSWNTPQQSANNIQDDERGEDSAEYFLVCLFTVPSSAEELMEKLVDQKIELECIELLPEMVSLRGTIRVMNLCFEKRVYVRTTMDGWDTYFDLAADFIPGSSDGETDRFSFTLPLAPLREEERCRVELCLWYETVIGNFWANNGGINYVMFREKRCSRDMKGTRHERSSIRTMKSCLKASSRDHVTEDFLRMFPIQIDAIKSGTDRAEKTSEDVEQHSEEAGESLMDWQTTRRNRRRAARMARVRNHFLQREAENMNRNEETPWMLAKTQIPPLEGALSLINVKDSTFATAVEMEAPHDEFWDLYSFHTTTDASKTNSVNTPTMENSESWCIALRERHLWEHPRGDLHGGNEIFEYNGSGTEVLPVFDHQEESVTSTTPCFHPGLSSTEETTGKVICMSQQDSEASSGQMMEMAEDQHPVTSSSKSVAQLEHTVESIASGLSLGAEVNAQSEKETSQAPISQYSENLKAEIKLTDLKSHKEPEYMPEADNSKTSPKDTKESTFIPELSDAKGGDRTSLGEGRVSSIQTKGWEHRPETHSITFMQEPKQMCTHGEKAEVPKENDRRQELIARDVANGQMENEKEQNIRKRMKEALIRNNVEKEGTWEHCKREPRHEPVVSGETDASHYATQETFYTDKVHGFFSTGTEESSHGGQGLGSSALVEKTEGKNMELFVFGVQNQRAAEVVAGDGFKNDFPLARDSSWAPVRSCALGMPFVRLSDDGEDAEVQSPSDVQRQPTSDKMAHVEGAGGIARGYVWQWNGSTFSARISRLLLYILLFAVICATAYQYGFLACFALYLFSACWLFHHEQKQDLHEGDRIDTQ